MADQPCVPVLYKPVKTTIKFEHPLLGYRIEFASQVWRLMDNYTQSWPWNREAGGQMFGRIDGYCLTVEEATGPRRSDLRTRHSFEIDTIAAATEIKERQAKDLTYLGDWHTHPEDHAKPSDQDRKNAGKLMKGAPQNPFLVLVIVGKRSTYVGVYNVRSLLQLKPVLRSRPWWL